MDTIKLGNHTGIPVVAQKHAKLRHRLSREDFEAVMTKDYDRESYRVLCILIPALKQTMPLWEWNGYVSQEAMDNDHYDEDNDPSPTTAEMVNAFETALMASGAGRMGKVVELVQTLVSLTPTQTASSPDSRGSTGA